MTEAVGDGGRGWLGVVDRKADVNWKQRVGAPRLGRSSTHYIYSNNNIVTHTSQIIITIYAPYSS